MSLTVKFNLKSPVHLFAVGFGSGLSPKAPGTFGTLAAIPFVFAFSELSLSIQICIALFMSVIGVWICGKAAKEVGVHDHPAIVWDEIAGFYITMLGAAISLQTLVVGFILFRFFDILKPWPIRLLDKKVSGGLGIMLDDVVAGIFSLLCLQALLKAGVIV